LDANTFTGGGAFQPIGEAGAGLAGSQSSHGGTLSIGGQRSISGCGICGIFG
jgi:hypothetical protein